MHGSYDSNLNFRFIRSESTVEAVAIHKVLERNALKLLVVTVKFLLSFDLPFGGAYGATRGRG